MTITLTPQTETRLREKAEREGQGVNAVADAIIAATLDGEAPGNTKTKGDEAWEVYYRFRDKIETPENIGKMILIDIDSGDYAIAPDDLGLAENRLLREKNPNADLFGLRIGSRQLSHFAVI